MTASRDTDPSAPRGRWTWHHHDHDNDHDHGGVGAQRRRRVLAVEFQRDLRPFFMVATSDDIQPCGQRTSAPSWSSRLVANLQASVAVFLNGDLKSAQSLMSEKVAFRELEMRYADQHLLRLSDNTRQSIETSSLHLDLLADFKRINSLFCSVAYPILESAGVLSKTRLLGEQPALFHPNETRPT